MSKERTLMISQPDFQMLDDQIQQLKRAAQVLNDNGDRFPAIKRNVARILASIKMMEINVSDIARLRAAEDGDTAP